MTGAETYAELKKVLRELEARGEVYRQRKGRYALPGQLNLATGRLQVTRAGDGFVVTAGEDTQDVFVRGDNLGSAVDGDSVVARIERRPTGRNPVGRVIRITERAHDRVVGTYHSRRGYGFVTPRRPRLRVDFFVPADFAGLAADGDTVVLEPVDWGETEPNPVGRILEVLGRADEPGVDVLAILVGYQLPVEFPAEVERDANRLAKRGIRPDDFAGRDDLRDAFVVTIDPPEARDHDDALSVRRLDGDVLEVGVHIADVSHYVAPDSYVDVEAAARGTSVYLVDRVVPMLPETLSGDLCSLVPGEDRLAFTALLTIGKNGDLDDVRFARSVITSRHKLDYVSAQSILDGTAPAEAELKGTLEALDEAAHRLRERRLARGSIDFDLPESRVVLNAAGEPTEVQRVMRLGTHRLVEDLMIRTNEAVAELASRQNLPILYRVHEAPDAEKLERLRELAAAFDHKLPPGRLPPQRIAELLRAVVDTPQEALLTTTALRSMKQARYAVDNLGHYGLASKAYLHFTSPIRRYPDLVVHRQLGRWLAGEQPPAEERAALQPVAIESSARERRAERAERDSVELKKIEYMERHLGDEFAGTISGVASYGVFVLLDDFVIDGLVHAGSLTDDYYELDEDRHALVGRRKRRVLSLGDPVRVQVIRVDRESRRIDLELV